MTFEIEHPATQNALLRRHVHLHARPLPKPYPAYVLIASVSDGDSRADVTTATGSSFEAAWLELERQVEELKAEKHLQGRWLRIDWPQSVERTTVRDLQRVLSRTKRNYFRLGLSLDSSFRYAFLEQELNGNAVLYGGNQMPNACLNKRNFAIYAMGRHGLDAADLSDDTEIHAFTAGGVFQDEHGTLHVLEEPGLASGRRKIDALTPDTLKEIIGNASDYLTAQVKQDGSFIYGYHPCFDRQIPTYNTLRHASTTYAMIEAFEVTRSTELGDAISRSVRYLTTQLIKTVALPDGTEAAFLVDLNNEIKLGGNAVALLALSKHAAAFNELRHMALMNKLALGILHMQNDRTGEFRHVLTYPCLSLKQQFRTIYYEGEAAFALMRFYDLTRDDRWLAAVEKAFEHFIAQKHFQHHDHWLSYCVNELTRYRPEERYFRFGLSNVADYLDFVATRITTFPTLLELMMAAEKMLTRIATIPSLRHLLREIDLEAFEAALEKRAHYLLNGHFFPEVAMFMRNPRRILGSFFIRHHAFRVRIDDVEHYLSGLIAYYAYLGEREAFREIVRSQTRGRPNLDRGFLQAS